MVFYSYLDDNLMLVLAIDTYLVYLLNQEKQ